MDNKNSNLSIAQEILYKNAVIKSHNTGEYGQTPESFKFKKNKISHIDIGFDKGKIMIKAFYLESRKCFYYDISEKQLQLWVDICLEFYNFDDFEEARNKILKENSISCKQKEEPIAKGENSW